MTSSTLRTPKPHAKMLSQFRQRAQLTTVTLPSTAAPHMMGPKTDCLCTLLAQQHCSSCCSYRGMGAKAASARAWGLQQLIGALTAVSAVLLAHARSLLGVCTCCYNSQVRMLLCCGCCSLSAWGWTGNPAPHAWAAASAGCTAPKHWG